MQCFSDIVLWLMCRRASKGVRRFFYKVTFDFSPLALCKVFGDRREMSTVFSSKKVLQKFALIFAVMPNFRAKLGKIGYIFCTKPICLCIKNYAPFGA